MFDAIINLLRGGTMVSCFGIGLFFVQFWLKSKDQIFAFFAVSFLALGVSQIWSITPGTSGDYVPFTYGLRLIAFSLIIIGIATKNLFHKSE